MASGLDRRMVLGAALITPLSGLWSGSHVAAEEQVNVLHYGLRVTCRPDPRRVSSFAVTGYERNGFSTTVFGGRDGAIRDLVSGFARSERGTLITAKLTLTPDGPVHHEVSADCAQAIRFWLMTALRLDPDHILSRGTGAPGFTPPARASGIVEIAPVIERQTGASRTG